MDIDADIRRIAREAARDAFLSIDDVAKPCNAWPKTVQRWIGKGLLRAIRSPGMRDHRVTRREYEAFVERGRSCPTVVRACDDADDLAHVGPNGWTQVPTSRGPRWQSHPSRLPSGFAAPEKAVIALLYFVGWLVNSLALAGAVPLALESRRA